MFIKEIENNDNITQSNVLSNITDFQWDVKAYVGLTRSMSEVAK